MEQDRTRDPAPLSPAEERAWYGFMTLVALGLPRVERTLRGYGLVHVEYLLLADLATQPAGRRMTELAGCVQSSLSRLSHRVRKLVARGYLVQEPVPGDRRATRAVITPRGREVVAAVGPAHLRDVRRMMFDQLSPAQLAALGEAMDTLARQLKTDEHP